MMTTSFISNKLFKNMNKDNVMDKNNMKKSEGFVCTLANNSTIVLIATAISVFLLSFLIFNLPYTTIFNPYTFWKVQAELFWYPIVGKDLKRYLYVDDDGKNILIKNLWYYGNKRFYNPSLMDTVGTNLKQSLGFNRFFVKSYKIVLPNRENETLKRIKRGGVSDLKYYFSSPRVEIEKQKEFGKILVKYLNEELEKYVREEPDLPPDHKQRVLSFLDYTKRILNPPTASGTTQKESIKYKLEIMHTRLSEEFLKDKNIIAIMKKALPNMMKKHNNNVKIVLFKLQKDNTEEELEEKSIDVLLTDLSNTLQEIAKKSENKELPKDLNFVSQIAKSGSPTMDQVFQEFFYNFNMEDFERFEDKKIIDIRYYRAGPFLRASGIWINSVLVSTALTILTFKMLKSYKIRCSL